MTHKAVLIAALAVVCSAPVFAQAEENTPTNTLKTQYKSLMERFDAMKKGKGMASTTKDKTEREGKQASSTIDRTCMATAVATREAAIGSAWKDFSADMTSALTKRTEAMVAAWNGSDTGSREALKKAWATWRTDSKAAHTGLKADRKAAWDAFKKTAKDSCKVAVPKEEGLESAAKDSLTL
ncbi:MAG: hypothetical protein RLZZ70_197 [Candidatus Parcubacteria bacterium]|jgi:hypothetical protein